MEKRTGYSTIDEYIALAPENTRQLLAQMRATIHAAAPEATERIAYQLPTFYQQGNLVHFGAFETHIGFYPTPSGIEAFKDELARFKGAKGTVQFPLDEPLPLELVSRIVTFRLQENLAQAQLKADKKKKGPRKS